MSMQANVGVASKKFHSKCRRSDREAGAEGHLPELNSNFLADYFLIISRENTRSFKCNLNCQWNLMRQQRNMYLSTVLETVDRSF